jgi:NAD(P)-dependent dehydrogenase (short-subunit alcohol dehydrogenase family)
MTSTAAKKLALIIGPKISGRGVSVSFAQMLSKAGYTVALASNDAAKIKPLCDTIGAEPMTVDTYSNRSIVDLFEQFDKKYGGVAPDVVLYSCLYSTSSGYDIKGDCGTIQYEGIGAALQGSAIGAFVAGQEAGKRMIPEGRGSIFFTGMTASIKGAAKRGVFAMGKFAQRGMAQSLYRELSPKGIHVCHFVVDGTVRDLTGDKETDESTFTPDAIAESYMSALAQPKGAWSWEIEVRHKDEKF